MEFNDSLGLRHRAERQAAEAPAFLRRDTDAGRAIGGAPEKGDVVRAIPYPRAIGDLVYELDTQAQLINQLYDRLAGVLETVPCDPDSKGTDPCSYSSAQLVIGLACQVQRVRCTNTQLVDILDRLAI